MGLLTTKPHTRNATPHTVKVIEPGSKTLIFDFLKNIPPEDQLLLIDKVAKNIANEILKLGLEKVNSIELKGVSLENCSINNFPSGGILGELSSKRTNLLSQISDTLPPVKRLEEIKVVESMILNELTVHITKILYSFFSEYKDERAIPEIVLSYDCDTGRNVMSLARTMGEVITGFNDAMTGQSIKELHLFLLKHTGFDLSDEDKQIQFLDVFSDLLLQIKEKHSNSILFSFYEKLLGTSEFNKYFEPIGSMLELYYFMNTSRVIKGGKFSKDSKANIGREHGAGKLFRCSLMKYAFQTFKYRNNPVIQHSELVYDFFVGLLDGISDSFSSRLKSEVSAVTKLVIGILYPSVDDIKDLFGGDLEFGIDLDNLGNTIESLQSRIKSKIGTQFGTLSFVDFKLGKFQCKGISQEEMNSLIQQLSKLGLELDAKKPKAGTNDLYKDIKTILSLYIRDASGSIIEFNSEVKFTTGGAENNKGLALAELYKACQILGYVVDSFPEGNISDELLNVYVNTFIEKLPGYLSSNQKTEGITIEEYTAQAIDDGLKQGIIPKAGTLFEILKAYMITKVLYYKGNRLYGLRESYRNGLQIFVW